MTIIHEIRAALTQADIMRGRQMGVWGIVCQEDTKHVIDFLILNNFTEQTMGLNRGKQGLEYCSAPILQEVGPGKMKFFKCWIFLTPGSTE